MLRIDTRALERTAAAKMLIGAFVGEEQLSEIEAICGLDPLAALSEATVWVRGPEDQPFQSIGLMLRGRAADAATLAECHRLLVETRGGSIVRLEGPAGPFWRAVIAGARSRCSMIGPSSPGLSELSRRLWRSGAVRRRLSSNGPASRRFGHV